MRKKQAAGRVGVKRSDRRWRGLDGQEWASKFEHDVFHVLKGAGYAITRCVKGKDSYSYRAPVRLGACGACGSSEVHTNRSYTPDFRVHPKGNSRNKGVVADSTYSIEAKGYLRAPQRALLRALRKCAPGMDLRFVFQRDYPVTKDLTITQWCDKFLKVKWCLWNGKDLPEGW